MTPDPSAANPKRSRSALLLATAELWLNWMDFFFFLLFLVVAEEAPFDWPSLRDDESAGGREKRLPLARTTSDCVSISGGGSGEGCRSGRWAQWVSADRVLFVPPALLSCSRKLGSRGADKQKGATVSHADVAFPQHIHLRRLGGGTAPPPLLRGGKWQPKSFFLLFLFFIFYL